MSDSQGEDGPACAPDSPTEPTRPCQSRCPLCAEFFSSPRLLPCLHTFCAACLERLEPFSDLGWRRQDSDSSSEGSWLQGERNAPPPHPFSILCPVCDADVELPPGGVRDLPTDHVALNEARAETLQGAGLGPACDLCADGEAGQRCQDCRVCLCQFCYQAHKRQKKTALHVVVELKELRGFAHLEKPIPCPSHPAEELKFFCEPCDRPVCPECVAGPHRHHPYSVAANVIHKHGDSLRQLLKATREHVGALEGALDRVERAGESLGRRAEALALEVRAFADGYQRAVEEHREKLLRSLEETRARREAQLQLQKAQLLQLLLDMRAGAEFTERLLAGGSDLEILLTKGAAERRLRALHATGYRARPAADDRLEFAPHEMAGLCRGYKVFGAILSRAAEPAKCVVSGKDVGGARQNQPVTWTLTCKDASDQQVEKGGDPVRVTVAHQERKDCVIKAAVQDNEDGTYSISYTPEEVGDYTVSVTIRGQHVQGSPFALTVKNKLQRHGGLFHCCTFCSSGGQKAARCACGGKMPGGYQGCGHGHKGHPGVPHWSCCGNVVESSECSVGQPPEDSLQRSLMRTVAL